MLDESTVEGLDLDALSESVRNGLMVKCLRWMRRARRIPLEVYLERLTTFPTGFVEIVPCYYNGQEYEILLERRADDEPHFGGKFCTMGSTILMRDGMDEIRLAHGERESGIPPMPGDAYTFAGAGFMPRLAREHALEFIFLRHLQKKPAAYEGTFVPLSKLKEIPLIPHMAEAIIPLVIEVLNGGKPGFFEYMGYPA